MIRPLLFVALTALSPWSAIAQLELPVRLVLNGTEDTDRQVLGLADPVQLDAAVNVEAARSQVLTTTTTTGTDILVGELQPGPTTLVPGMLLTIIPQAANSAGASLDLGGTGAYPLVKWGEVAVDSADLPVGVPSRVIFDGSRYQVLNWNARPCAAGTIAGSALYCIDAEPRGTDTYYNAVNTCTARGGRLCTFGEWSSACRRNPVFLPTVVAYEWLEDAANNPNDAKVMGQGYNGPEIMQGIACEYGNSHAPLNLNLIRCCYNR